MIIKPSLLMLLAPLFFITSFPAFSKKPDNSNTVEGIPLEVLLIVEEIAEFSGDKNYVKNFVSKQVTQPKSVPQLSPQEKLFQSQQKQFQQQTQQQQKQFANTATQQVKSFTQILDAAKKRHADTIKRWQREYRSFQKEVPHLKEALVKMTDTQVVDFKKLNAPVSKLLKNPYKVVYKSMDIPVKSQGRRPTCSAFAGVRLLEILLAQQGRPVDLSEQHFYWLSKPSCQKNKCQKRGAWVTAGYHQSRKKGMGIATEKACPYHKKQIAGNETQLPLPLSCLKTGKVQVSRYQRFQSLDEVVSLLDADIPVAVGTRLSRHFYGDKGFIAQAADGLEKNKVDSHAKGHALVIVGYMKLPQKLYSSEGRLCFLVSNSWGEGWGKGGHACLSEKWLREHRLHISFVAPIAVDSLSF